jgi:hypothetical protein
VSSHILVVDIFESVEENRFKFKQNKKQNLNKDANTHFELILSVKVFTIYKRRNRKHQTSKIY